MLLRSRNLAIDASPVRLPHTEPLTTASQRMTVGYDVLPTT